MRGFCWGRLEDMVSLAMPTNSMIHKNVKGFFWDLLFSCVFTLVRLQWNQNHHVTLKLGFPMSCLWTCLFGGIRLWCSFVPSKTNPYWSHSGEICGSKRYKKTVQREQPRVTYLQLQRSTFSFEKRNMQVASAGAQTASSGPNDSRSFAFWSSNIQEVFSASGSFI